MESQALIRDLIEQRQNAWDHAKALLDKLDEEKRTEWTAEESVEFERMNADIDALGARIRELEESEQRKRDLDEQRDRYRHVVTPADGDLQEATLEDEFRSFLKGESGRSLSVRIDARAKQRSAGVEYRDLSKLSAAAGANVVPTGFVSKLYEHLVEVSAVRQAGATVLTTDSGENLLVPKTTAHGSAALVAETAAITENDPTFGQVTLNAYKYGVLIQVSSELITDTAVDLLGYVARQAGRALGLASGAHFITGTGTAQPEGVATNVTTGKTGTTGQTLTVIYDDLIDLYHSIVSGYRARSSWLMKDSSLASIRKLKDTTNQPIWQPGLVSGAPDTLLGRPIFTDPGVAAMAASAKSILFGDFGSYYTIRDVAGVRFERSDDYAFGNDLVTFRALLRTDGKPIDTTAVKAYVNSAT